MKRESGEALARSIFTGIWPSDANRASHGERWISAMGGFIGVLAVLWLNSTVLDHKGATMVIGSMGASAVLLFAVPHGALSQPWAVLGGHVISALIGVASARMLGDPYAAAAVAVGLSIAAMYYLHCIHPPGGATALVAVLGGDAVHQLGYGFVITPVLECALLILAVAVLVNLPFSWRRYPAGLMQKAPETESDPDFTMPMIAHQDLVYALSELDSFIDVSEEDLIRIYNLAVHHTHSPRPLGNESEQDHDTCICTQPLEADR